MTPADLRGSRPWAGDPAPSKAGRTRLASSGPSMEYALPGKRVIETVRGYGYRFVAPVTGLSPALHDASGAPQDPPATRSAPTLTSAPPLLPEWRHLTVLRCGLVPTVRVERLDPDDFQGVVQAFYTTCEAVIAPFRGTSRNTTATNSSSTLAILWPTKMRRCGRCGRAWRSVQRCPSSRWRSTGPLICAWRSASVSIPGQSQPAQHARRRPVLPRSRGPCSA